MPMWSGIIRWGNLYSLAGFSAARASAASRAISAVATPQCHLGSRETAHAELPEDRAFPFWTTARWGGSGTSEPQRSRHFTSPSS